MCFILYVWLLVCIIAYIVPILCILYYMYVCVNMTHILNYYLLTYLEYDEYNIILQYKSLGLHEYKNSEWYSITLQFSLNNSKKLWNIYNINSKQYTGCTISHRLLTTSVRESIRRIPRSLYSRVNTVGYV